MPKSFEELKVFNKRDLGVVKEGAAEVERMLMALIKTLENRHLTP